MIPVPENAVTLVALHEGFSAQVYWDKTGEPIGVGPDGNPTVGYGINVGPTGGLMMDEAQALLEMRLERIAASLSQVDRYFSSLSDARKAAVLDVAYNVGINGWLGFTDTRKYLAAGDFSAAASALLDSDAARELSARYHQDAEIIRTGIFPASIPAVED